MKPHAPTPRSPSSSGRPAGTDGRGLYHLVVDRFLLLPLGSLIALVWANTAGDSYFRFAHALAFLVNQVGMAFFLALVAQDVREAVMPGGTFYTWRRWTVPLLAASGGFAGAAGVYLAYAALAHQTVLNPGWPIACAVDIAAAYYVLRLVTRRRSVLAFLVLTAAATDVGALLVAAVFPPFGSIDPTSLALLAGALGVAWFFRRIGRYGFWPYLLVAGPLAWTSLYLAGLPPALALVPLVPFLPRRARTEVFADPEPDDSVHRTEHEWHLGVQVVLFFFGLVNAGVILRGIDTGTWAILAGALVGRPLGIVAATGAAVAVGLKLPRGLGWREVLVAALATTSGFTFALLLTVGLLPVGSVLSQIKLGALLTAVGAGATLVVGHWLRLDRSRDISR
ncbi:MAG: Na+/H+ antiporter NhaA [Vicinamibacterales bacterium]